jgi:hypothetical protein
MPEFPADEELRRIRSQRARAAEEQARNEAAAEEALRREYESIISEFAVRAKKMGIQPARITDPCSEGICEATGYPLGSVSPDRVSGYRGSVVAVPPHTYRIRRQVPAWSLFGNKKRSSEEELPVVEPTVFYFKSDSENYQSLSMRSLREPGYLTRKSLDELRRDLTEVLLHGH